MNPDALRALAWSRGYLLLGDLFARGLTEETRAAWRQVPAAAGLELDLDAMGEARARLLLLELAPFESAFRSADGLVGGDIADAVRSARARTGIGPVREPDQLGEELRWLGWLAGAEADGLRDGVDVEHVRVATRGALDQHLLRWLPALAGALDGLDATGAAALYRIAMDTALELAVAHRRALGGEPEAWELPPAVDVLADPKVGLRGIAEHLCLPVQAGGWFARGAILGMSRALDLPASFGARADLLEGLLRSGAHYGRLDELCVALDAELVRWDRRWGQLDGGLAPIAAPWRGRIAATRAVVARIGEAGMGAR